MSSSLKRLQSKLGAIDRLLKGVDQIAKELRILPSIDELDAELNRETYDLGFELSSIYGRALEANQDMRRAVDNAAGIIDEIHALRKIGVGSRRIA